MAAKSSKDISNNIKRLDGILQRQRQALKAMALDDPDFKITETAIKKTISDIKKNKELTAIDAEKKKKKISEMIAIYKEGGLKTFFDTISNSPSFTFFFPNVTFFVIFSCFTVVTNSHSSISVYYCYCIRYDPDVY